MRKVVFITPRDAQYGFSLTGVTHYVTDSDKAEQTLRSVIGSPDIGLVIIDERLMNSIGDEKREEIEKKWKGILLVLPSPERPEAEVEDYVSRLIRRAIGYHVRLNI